MSNVVIFPTTDDDGPRDRWQILADMAYALDGDADWNMMPALDAVLEAFPEPADASTDFKGYAVSRFARALHKALYGSPGRHHAAPLSSTLLKVPGRATTGTRRPKLSPIQRWMIEHPNDVPPPLKSGGAPLREWKRKRGLLVDSAEMARYQAALADSRKSAAR